MFSISLEPILEPSLRRRIVTTVTAIVLPLIAFAALVWWTNEPPTIAFQYLLLGSIGSTNAVIEIFVSACPLLIMGLGIMLAFKSGVWNIGGEGQLYMGALAATWLGLEFRSWGDLPILFIPAIIAMAFLAGAAWAAIVGALKAYFKVNEVISSVMLNTPATLLASYLLHGPWLHPYHRTPISEVVAAAAQLPILIPGSRFHFGIVLAFALVPLMYVLLFRTVFGYRIRAVGANTLASLYAGIKVNRNIVYVMILSGGIVGIGGAIELIGLQHQMRPEFSPGFGFTAIVVALLGGLNPIGIAVAAVFYAFLFNGMQRVQTSLGTPSGLIYSVEAFLLVSIAASYVISKYRIKVKWK